MDCFGAIAGLLVCRSAAAAGQRWVSAVFSGGRRNQQVANALNLHLATSLALTFGFETSNTTRGSWGAESQ